MVEEYLKVIKDNNIKSMYHFTNISNLESIIKYGLCNRKYMDNNKIEYKYTDENRFDEQIDCISLSIGSINKNMLHYKNNDFNNDWIIFEFDAQEIIRDYYNVIYYCKYNASSIAVRNLLNTNQEYLKSVQAFKNMFKTYENYLQGELLLKGIIPFKYIKNIYVNSLPIKMIVQEILYINGINNINTIIKKEMY